MTDTLPTTRPDWKIEWRGHTWTESDISGAHFAVLVMLTGRDDISMIDLDPFIYDAAGAVSDVHGLRLMVVLQMFVAQQFVTDYEATGDEDPEAELAVCVAKAVDEVAKASMADEILPALSFKE